MSDENLPVPTRPPAKRDRRTEIGLDQELAAPLAYVLGWVSGLVLLVAERNEYVRFHAMQSVLVFGPMSVVLTVLSWIPLINLFIGVPLAFATLLLWAILIAMAMLKGEEGERFKLPFVGTLAEELLAKL